MTLRHAAALTLVGWYLMVPPVVDNAPGHSGKWVAAIMNGSLTNWEQWASYDTAKECNDFRFNESSDTAHSLVSGKIPPEKRHAIEKYYAEIDLAQCIATDDPRLKRY
jgi:hypothetical protein